MHFAVGEAANRKRERRQLSVTPKRKVALSKTQDESSGQVGCPRCGIRIPPGPGSPAAPCTPKLRVPLGPRGRIESGAMAERRAAGKSRRLGSSRRKQLYNSSNETPAPAPSPGEEPPWASEIAQRVQELLRERDKEQAGFITRSDMQKLQEEDFPCSTEELELIFDGLDAAGTGRLSTEEFTAGLRQFLSSQKAARDHRRRKTASRRVRLAIPSVMLEGVDSEEQRHFAAFMDQLGTDNVSEEQEIWQLWVKLRQDEPQLLGNLEEFLAKMRHRIQEARSKKEALEKILNKRVAEHEQEVQQLCETLEQQIQEERQRLQQESMARSHQHSVELQRALDASEREVQRLVTAQMELETRCRSLRSTEQATSAENRQLEESNRVLEDRLRLLHRQLQQTHEHLRTTRATVALEDVEEMGDRAVAELPGEVPLSPQMGPEKSEKHRSEMRIRLGSQSIKPKSTHQVVWEKLPAEISVLGAPRRASSTEEEPFPEFLKEERLSDQSSLLREMNEAIAALSKQLKPPALGAPPAPADAARHPQDDAEPQIEPEADTAHGTTPGGLRETLLGHIGHEVFEGDLKKGPTAAELRAPDVTQADVWQPGASGQVAQSELQEQADNVSLHTVSQQPVKLPHMVEMKQADGPSEHPKQEVPPASTLRIRGQQEGNDQLGMVLGDSSPGGAANSSTQPHQQLLGEQSGDLNFAPRQKQQEVGQNTSQEGKASAGEPGATAAGGAGAAPRGSPEVSLDPDHLFNVLFVGDSHVGKTSFLYRLHADTFNPHLTATVGLDYQVKNLIVDNRRFALRLWDSAGQERYRSITKQFFRKADGVVLMYDITSEYSFSDVRYWLSCIQEGAEDGVAILLLGNKTDCAAERQVPVEEGERLAKEHQLMFYECSAASGHNVSESMVSFIRLLKDHEDKLKNKAEEEPKPPQKKKGCCW
ncbi:ras-related protein Rab-44 isoform C [Patagioenas fasciata monilis]|uniref:Ras-related protein Rab-44 isoform C n=1 Tax=Patagioenas fasciata monilis TaxID=372326 RepID=A0A1V4KWZ3_PATFA|nr:ras-related protein Rab-44 isoform C [Patagioenas fasciata monilis]